MADALISTISKLSFLFTDTFADVSAMQCSKKTPKCDSDIIFSATWVGFDLCSVVGWVVWIGHPSGERLVFVIDCFVSNSLILLFWSADLFIVDKWYKSLQRKTNHSLQKRGAGYWYWEQINPSPRPSPLYSGWLFLSKQQGVHGLGKCFGRKEKYNDKYKEKDKHKIDRNEEILSRVGWVASNIKTTQLWGCVWGKICILRLPSFGVLGLCRGVCKVKNAVKNNVYFLEFCNTDPSMAKKTTTKSISRMIFPYIHVRWKCQEIRKWKWWIWRNGCKFEIPCQSKRRVPSKVKQC